MPTTRTAFAPAVVVLLAVASAARAGPHMPNLSTGLGATTAVSSSLDRGGFAWWGAAMWPVEGFWSFGIEAFADDIGNDLEPAIRAGSPPVSLGTIEKRHRFVWGGGWRLEAQLPNHASRWEPTAQLTWSGARIQDDARGTVLDAESASGLGIGLGLRRPILQHSTVGVVVRYHHLFSDLVDGYVSGGVEWGWRFGKTP